MEGIHAKHRPPFNSISRFTKTQEQRQEIEQDRESERCRLIRKSRTRDSFSSTREQWLTSSEILARSNEKTLEDRIGGQRARKEISIGKTEPGADVLGGTCKKERGKTGL